MDVDASGSEQGQIARWLASYFKGKQSTVFAAVVRACHLDVDALSASGDACRKRSHSDADADADATKHTDTGAQTSTHKRQRLLHNNKNQSVLPSFSSYSSSKQQASAAKQPLDGKKKPNENTSPTKRTWSSSGMEISPRKPLLQRSSRGHVNKRAARGVSLPGWQ
jgi:hypothetical protein